MFSIYGRQPVVIYIYTISRIKLVMPLQQILPSRRGMTQCAGKHNYYSKKSNNNKGRSKINYPLHGSFSEVVYATGVFGAGGAE